MAVDAHGDRSDSGDLGGDLGRRQKPSEARFGPLAELDLDSSHRVFGTEIDEPGKFETPAGISNPKIAGADLENKVATLLVVGRKCALSGGLPATGEPGALVHRRHRCARKGTEAHAGDVDD